MEEISPPSFDIAIEWENAKLGGFARARKMLERLRAQLVALAPRRRPQILMLYDPREVDVAAIERLVAEAFAPAGLPGTVRFVPAPGARYYEQKNLAASLCDGEVIVFIDCDVIPEDGWLAVILAPFARRDVKIVYGQTYVDPASLLAKAAAIYWFFPVQNPASALPPATSFYANNIAFRRDFFRRNPFPDMPIYRGQCAVLRQRLSDRGIGLVTQDDAVVLHPPPNGIRHFMIEAIHEGHGEVLMAGATRHEKRTWSLRSTLQSYRWSLGECLRKLRAHREILGLGFFGGGVALALGFVYYTLKAAGAAATLRWPNLIPRLFPIEAPASPASAARTPDTSVPDIAPIKPFADIGVAIVVPTYRRPNDLDWLMEKLRAQIKGYSNRRAIVVNDGSHDQRYQAVIERHRDIADYIVAPRNGGPAAARNLGAARADKEFLVFIDDDCEPPPYWLDWLCTILAEHPDADAIGGTTRALPSTAPGMFERFLGEAGFHPQPLVANGRPLMFVSANLAVRRKAFERVGGFDETMITTEDRNLTYRLGRSGAIFHLDTGWFVYHDMAVSPRTHLRRYYHYGVGNRRELAIEENPPDRPSWPTATRPWIYWFGRARYSVERMRQRRDFREHAAPMRLLYRLLGALTYLVMDWGFARGAGAPAKSAASTARPNRP